MTRSEAIKILWQYDVNFEPHPAEDVMHAIDMAIEALEQEETLQNLTKPNKSDLISRQAAIDAVWSLDVELRPSAIEAILDRLNGLPSAQSKQRWIPCSERLPKIKEHHTSEPCIVYCDNGAYMFAELEENIFGQVGWNCERDDDYHEAVGTVIAWMPFPEGYKESEEQC